MINYFLKPISYASFLKKQVINREQELEKKIENLEQKITIHGDNTALLKEIDEIKIELEAFRLKQNEEIPMRSRIKWMEYGEKPYFF